MPGFALVDYNIAAATAGATNADLSMVADPDFTNVQSGHLVLTEPYKLLGVFPVGVSVIRGRFQIPTWNAVGEMTIFNANRGLQPTSNGQWDLYLARPATLPTLEQIQIQLSNNLGASTEQENVGVLLATPDWTQNLPQPGGVLGPALGVFCVRASFTVTPTINAWSGGQNLTFSQSLRSGTYAVVGAICQGTNSAFFRLIFPKYALQRGRKLRPGWPVQTAVGDVVQSQLQPWVMAMGEWGRFHSYEPLTCEVLGTTASSTTYQLFLFLVMVSDDMSGLKGGLGGG